MVIMMVMVFLNVVTVKSLRRLNLFLELYSNRINTITEVYLETLAFLVGSWWVSVCPYIRQYQKHYIWIIQNPDQKCKWFRHYLLDQHVIIPKWQAPHRYLNHQISERESQICQICQICERETNWLPGVTCQTIQYFNLKGINK